MTLEPQVLLDTSIAQLQILASFLAEEMGSFGGRSQAVTPEMRACKELLMSISVLLPKLQAAKYVLPQDPPAHCVLCED